MNLTVIPIINWSLGKISKALVSGLKELAIGGQIKTIQIKAEYLRRLEKIPYHSNFSEKLATKKSKFDNTNKWYMHNPAPVLENDTHKLLWDFYTHRYRLISARRPDLMIINKKKKRIWKIVDFAITADQRIKLREFEKRDKNLDIARELKKLWNMKVTIIPIVIGAFGTITKGLLKGLEDLEVGGRVENIQTTTLLRTARILKRVLESWGDLLSLKFQWKTISKRWCERL